MSCTPRPRRPRGWCLFTLALLKAKLHRLPDTLFGYLAGEGDSLQLDFQLLEEAHRVVPAGTAQRMLDAVKQHVVCNQKAGIHLRPKRRLLLLLAGRGASHRKHIFYKTFTDGRMNRVLKEVGQAAHRPVWEVRMCVHFDRLLRQQSGQNRSAPQGSELNKSPMASALGKARNHHC